MGQSHLSNVVVVYKQWNKLNLYMYELIQSGIYLVITKATNLYHTKD